MWDVLRDNWRYLLLGPFPNGPLGGLALTLAVSVVALLLTLPAAIGVALMRTSGLRSLAVPATIVVYGVRSIPLLLLVFWAYFLAPVVFGTNVDPTPTLVAAIVVYQTAYLSEVVRAGIEALPPGQAEAARALGLRWYTRTRRVILPQALYNVLPGILNQLTAIIKESSLGAVIAAGELTYVANQVNNILVTRPFQVFGVLAAGYFVLCLAVTQAARHLERRVARKRGAVALRGAPSW